MHFSPLVRLACRALFGMALAAPIVAVAGPGLHYSGTPVDVPTYHYDSARTGWNRSETDLTPATVASTRFGLLKTLGVDGDVLAQPLLISNFVMPDGSTHDILVVVTGHNSVYAFDAQTYAVLWQVNLGPSQASSDIGCHELDPEYGISSTPVIVRSAPNAATLYVVSATEPSRSRSTPSSMRSAWPPAPT